MKRLLAAAAFVLLATTAHADTLPKEFRGYWCADADQSQVPNLSTYERKDCRETDGTLTISAKGFLWRESACDVLTVKQVGHAHRVRFDCDGEGLKWSSTVDLFIETERLTNQPTNRLNMTTIKRSKERLQ